MNSIMLLRAIVAKKITRNKLYRSAEPQTYNCGITGPILRISLNMHTNSKCATLKEGAVIKRGHCEIAGTVKVIDQWRQ